MTKQDPSANRIVLRPRVFDRMCVGFLVLCCLGSVELGVMALTHTARPQTVHCDRGSGRCTYFFDGPFNGDTYSNAIAEWKSSKVITRRNGDKTWKVERTSTPLWLGTDTKDAATIALYQRMSADLQAFLDDPTRPTYDAVFPLPPPVSHFPLIFVFGFGLLLGWFGFRWWRGWYATLELDAAQRAITIHRHPMFFTGPRTVTRHVKDLRLVERVEQRSVGRGNRAKFAVFQLREQSTDSLVFKYAALYDGRTRAKLDGEMALLSRFFAEAGGGR